MANKIVETGLKKMTTQSKQSLKKWSEDLKSWQDVGDTVLASEIKGNISGYLNALVHMGVIELDEGVELYAYYTR